MNHFVRVEVADLESLSLIHNLISIFVKLLSLNLGAGTRKLEVIQLLLRGIALHLMLLCSIVIHMVQRRGVGRVVASRVEIRGNARVVLCRVRKHMVLHHSCVISLLLQLA